MKRRTLAAALTALVVPLTGSLLAPWPALSASPRTVDPGTVQPPLNPDFAPYDCWTSGAAITCRGESRATYEHEPIGLECDGRAVFVSGSERARITRWHHSDGRATRTVLHTDYPADVLTLSADGSGPQAVLSAHWQKHYDYVVPGSLDDRVLTETGRMMQVRVPGRGVTFRDVGTLTFLPGFEYEVVSEEHGVHDMYAGGDVDAAICDALT